MFAILVLLGLAVLVVGCIKLIISAIRRKPKKMSMMTLIAGFIMFSVGIAITPASEEVPTSTVTSSTVTGSKTSSSNIETREPEEKARDSEPIDNSIIPEESDATSQIVADPASSDVSAPAPEPQAVENTPIIASDAPVQAPVDQVQPSEAQISDQSYVPEQHETAEQEQIVYWGESGTKYHINPNCRSFQGNTPNSGSIEDAIAAGRTGWCGICSKGMK